MQVAEAAEHTRLREAELGQQTHLALREVLITLIHNPDKRARGHRVGYIKTKHRVGKGRGCMCVCVCASVTIDNFLS